MRGGRAVLALEARVTDAWDADFALDRQPLTGAASGAAATRPRARGMLALIPSSRTDHDPALPGPSTHSGVYAIDFRPLGFIPRGAGPVPTLVATAIAPDTLVGLLPADGDEGALLFRGTVAGDSVTGTWSYGGHALGGWSGRFVLRRHRRVGA